MPTSVGFLWSIMAKLELLSRTVYDADGVQTVWDFNFAGGYLLPDHVKAYYELGTVRTPLTITPASLIGPNQLYIFPPVPAGAVLTIYRDTPKNAPLVDFVDRGTVSEIALDTVAKQAVFVAAEVGDSAATGATDTAVTAAVLAQTNALAAAGAQAAAAASALSAAASAATAASTATTLVNGHKAELVSSLGSSLIGFILGAVGAVKRTLLSKLSDSIHAKDFGAVCDGVTDDTVAMVNAMKYCRAAKKELHWDGRLVFNADSVPTGDKFAGTGGDYVNACSLVGKGDATLIVNGKVGFSLTGLSNTRVEGFRVNTTGRGMGEADAEGSSPYLFVTASGSKESAVYRDLVVNHGVLDLTGAYRTFFTIFEYGAASVVVDNVVVHNTICGVAAFNCSNVSVKGTYFYNTQTAIYFNDVDSFQVEGSHLINTLVQRDRWVSRTHPTTPRVTNGMDHLLVEGGSHGTVKGLMTSHAHERACYIQASHIKLSDCLAINCDGYKTVGLTYEAQAESFYIDNCHVYLDASFQDPYADRTEGLIYAYWGKNLNVSDCSIINNSSRIEAVPAAVQVGYPDGSTFVGATITNVIAINVVRLWWTLIAEKTAPQLAAMTPPGSFVAVRNVKIKNCFVRTSGHVSPQGALFEVRYGSTNSTESVVNYAAEDVEVTDNVVEVPPLESLRPEWLYSLRWVNGFTGLNNRVNRPLKSLGWFDLDFDKANAPSVMITVPYNGVKVNEPYLHYATGSGQLVDQLVRVNLLAGSSLKFTIVNGEQRQTVEANTSINGPAINGNVEASFYGKGYALLTTNRGFAVDMSASGNQYFGKVIGGTRTDQLGTPPINIVSTTSEIGIRGESQPSVTYRVKLTLI